MTGIRIGVVVRAEDGVFQPMVLQSHHCGHVAAIYRITGCVLRKTRPEGDEPPIITQSDLREDVFVFVNVPLETVNHMFLNALAALAMRPDAGIVSGILIDQKRRIVCSGWERAPGEECKDHYAGQFLNPSTFNGVREVTGLSACFFAVRRETLSAVGGFGILSSRRMPQLLQRLLTYTSDAGLQTRVIPDAIATLAGFYTTEMLDCLTSASNKDMSLATISRIRSRKL